MTISDTPAIQGIGIREAASRFEALLSPEETQDAPEATPATQAAEEAVATDDVADAPVETDEDDVIAEEADQSEEDVDEEATEEVTAEDEEAPEAEDEKGKLYTVKIDGKEEQVTLEEALKGYQREAVFTRKSMALAEEKKSFEPERDAVRLERAQYAQLLPVLVQQIKASMDQEPDWERLIDHNPAEYIRQEKLWTEKKERLSAAQQEQARLNALAEEEYRAQLAETVKQNGAKLAEAMPQWKTPERWNADKAKLLDYGQKVGWSADELNATYDNRAVITLYKAMRYDEIMAKRPKPTAKTSPKPATAGAVTSKPVKQVSDLSRAKQRLSKTGKVRDAASLFELLLE